MTLNRTVPFNTANYSHQVQAEFPPYTRLENVNRLRVMEPSFEKMPSCDRRADRDAVAMSSGAATPRDIFRLAEVMRSVNSSCTHITHC